MARATTSRKSTPGTSPARSRRFRVSEKTWHWDVNALYSRNHADQTFTGNVNAQRVQQALGPVSQCTGACTPLNIFGGAGTITPAMLAFIGFTQQDSSQQELTDFSANLTGDIFDLPAGPARLRRRRGASPQRGLLPARRHRRRRSVVRHPAQPASGKITVKEAYGELRIPIWPTCRSSTGWTPRWPGAGSTIPLRATATPTRRA
jgi:iron complex outermembrane receptor protein